jgi:hypothetical protein
LDSFGFKSTKFSKRGRKRKNAQITKQNVLFGILRAGWFVRG